MRSHRKSVEIVTPLDKYIDEIDAKLLGNVNIVSWLRILSLRYLLYSSKGQKGARIKFQGRVLSIKDFKRRLLEDICNELYSQKNKELKILLDRANKKMDYIKDALHQMNYSILDIPVRTVSKLIIGMSDEFFGKQIYDVGLTWDPYLNLPYIPASSLKGAFRAYLYLKRITINDRVAEKLLGTTERVSYIVFTDSYPISLGSRSLLTPEVTTPIYREIEGRIYESLAEPVPIIYPVINKDVTFRIIVGIKPEKVIKNEKDRQIASKLRVSLSRYLLDMLRYGIGAKTLIGYGILSKP